MTKITLDDIDYDTDDFTTDQSAVMKEIQLNGSSKGSLEYQLYCVNAQGDRLVNTLKASLTSNNEPADATI
tara:strand:+ start:196 stop:408 length:213 start_codon:yes stop_codon:yes gene_type:complete